VIDLHVHSTVSDGSDAPDHLPHLAKAAGCTAMALTDHDSVAGLEIAMGVGADVGVEVIPGVEISCEVATGTMHLLVYFIDPRGGPLQTKLEELATVREERNKRLVQTLAGLGLPITYRELLEEAGGQGVGRPHVAAVLMRKGVVSSIQEAFDVWLARGKPGYVEKQRLTPLEALTLATDSFGVPVLAHPLSLELKGGALRAALEDLQSMGLKGVEAIYGRYRPEEREGLKELARSLGLVATGGSDHHGTYKPDLNVGVGRGDLRVPDSVLVELQSRRP
jgi:3',5'-nucleoside bisphosphate phosphatase